MKKNLSLKIPKPCSEKWSKFEQTAGGGYCNSCSKVVVDFTNMSDEQIVSYFKSKSTHTCGRFLPTQLKEYRIEKTSTVLLPRPSWFKVAALSLGFIFSTNEGSANVHSSIIEINPTKNNSDQRHLPKTITGRVTSSEDGSALPGVNVWVKGTDRGAVTDKDGYFEIQQLKVGDVLVFSFIGFMSQEVEIGAKTPEVYILKMEMDLDMLGEVAVEGIYSSGNTKPGLWARIKNIF